jgi:hypothetical protein
MQSITLCDLVQQKVTSGLVYRFAPGVEIYVIGTNPLRLEVKTDSGKVRRYRLPLGADEKQIRKTLSLRV